MLYNVVPLTYPSQYNQFTVPSGSLGVFRLPLASGQAMVLQMNQLLPDPRHFPQDMTMRCWIANSAGGNPLPVDSNAWILTALQRRIITVYDAFAGLGPFEGITVDLAPGTYWLNILNLVNESNSFYLEIDQGA